MDISAKLLKHGKRTITLDELASDMGLNVSDVQNMYSQIEALKFEGIVEPVKNSGKNGNISYPLYKKYRILIKEQVDENAAQFIKGLHPLLLKSGYLSANPDVYNDFRTVIDRLNIFFFEGRDAAYISRKERSFAIFGQEKTLDDTSVKTLLRKLQITDSDLLFYDTPEYCFHDYIPVRKDNMTLLICENKDIWFNIRRCMFEDGLRKLFGVDIDGVVYGEGNRISDKSGALKEYVKFMGNPSVKFLYWGDIDREGFDIFRRTRSANDSLDISLFIPGYKKMIEKAFGLEPEDSPSSKKEGMRFDDLLTFFSDEEQLFIKKILGQNKLIPQEIIPYTLVHEEGGI